MDLLKHDIVSEFPDHKDRVHALKTTDHHFARLYEEYDQVNHEVIKNETGAAVMADEALEDLKKKRLRVKDEMVKMILAA